MFYLIIYLNNITVAREEFSVKLFRSFTIRGIRKRDYGGIQRRQKNINVGPM